MAELTASGRNFEIVGTLSELNLVEEERDIQLEGGKKVKGSAIHGDLVVEVNGQPINVKLMWTNSVSKDGKDNGKKYKAMSTIMNTYIPKTKATADKPADRIKLTGMLGLNEYATEDGEYKSNVDITAMNCTRNVGDAEDKAVAKFTKGVIKSIKPEMIKKGEDTEETGRKEILYYLFDKNSALLPIKVFVDTDLADEVDDYFEKGNTVDIDVNIVQRTVGGAKKTAKKGFGKQVDITNGFSIQELVLSWGSEAYEDEVKLDLKLVQTAEKERETMIETAIAKKKEDSKNGGGKKTGGSTGTKKGLGTQQKIDTPTSDEEIEDSELPF